MRSWPPPKTPRWSGKRSPSRPDPGNVSEGPTMVDEVETKPLQDPAGSRQT